MLIGTEEVVLDPAHVKFTEETINEYLQNFNGWYSYYNKKFAEAQYIASLYDDKYEEAYAEKFKAYKETRQCSDKLAEAYAKSDPQVVEALQKARTSKHNMQQLNGFLRAMDKAHTNCLNLCYNLRKELGNMTDSVKSLDEILGKK